MALKPVNHLKQKLVYLFLCKKHRTIKYLHLILFNPADAVFIIP